MENVLSFSVVERKIKMNKCEYAFMISHLKKAIYNLERAKAYDDEIVSYETIQELKEMLILYQTKNKAED